MNPVRASVGGVAAEVVEVPVERHALGRGPVAVGEAGGRADMGDARRPGCVVGLVVLRAERLQPEVVADQGRWRREVVGTNGELATVRTLRRPPPLVRGGSAVCDLGPLCTTCRLPRAENANGGRLPRAPSAGLDECIFAEQNDVARGPAPRSQRHIVARPMDGRVSLLPPVDVLPGERPRSPSCPTTDASRTDAAFAYGDAAAVRSGREW